LGGGRISLTRWGCRGLAWHGVGCRLTDAKVDRRGLLHDGGSGLFDVAAKVFAQKFERKVIRRLDENRAVQQRQPRARAEPYVETFWSH
jgi:hypothetical protein